MPAGDSTGFGNGHTVHQWPELVHHSEHVNNWGVVDMSQRLRMRSFLSLCIVPLLERLEMEFALSRMRDRGISRVIYFADFRQHDLPLVAGGAIRTEHTLKMHHVQEEDDGATPSNRAAVKRLLWHSVNRIHAQVQPQEVSGELPSGSASTGSLRPVGESHAIHILTRPTAPPGERAVVDVPEELQWLLVHPWCSPLPTANDLIDGPEGCQAASRAYEHSENALWGLPNTDIKQHVNVLEYIMSMENQVTQHLHGAGFDVRVYGIRRLQMLFRKPFFAGDAFSLKTRLYLGSDCHYVTGAFYRLRPGRTWETSPAVVARAAVAPFGAHIG